MPTKLCPSAQPGMDRSQVIGVVDHGGPKPRVGYLDHYRPATPEVLALAAPLRPTEVFRLAGTCAEGRCPHFDGADCQLASRIVALVPPAVDVLPACQIRKECRWFAQEGGAACQRCPHIATVSHDLSPRSREISGLPVMQDPS